MARIAIADFFCSVVSGFSIMTVVTSPGTEEAHSRRYRCEDSCRHEERGDDDPDADLLSRTRCHQTALDTVEDAGRP